MNGNFPQAATPGSGDPEPRFRIVFSMFGATFIEMIHQGYRPVEAFGVAITVSIGGAIAVQRLPKDRDDRGGPRWA